MKVQTDRTKEKEIKVNGRGELEREEILK